MEGHILTDWGLKNCVNSALIIPKTISVIQRLNLWSPPPTGFLKLNIDKYSKGNPRKEGYGFIIRDYSGKMLSYGYGFLGKDSNKPTEIKGLIQGLEWVIENYQRPIIAEGVSQIIILLASKLQNGSQSTKVSSSWILERRIVAPPTCLINGYAVHFTHLRRKGNKLAYSLANVGVGTCTTLRARDWNLLPVLIALN